MATHGRARELTISALSNRKPFSRPGFAMKGVEGASTSYGQLPKEILAEYEVYAAANNIFYTVLSYKTPIAWVTWNEKVVIPDVKYSVTTTHHQSLCRAYL